MFTNLYLHNPYIIEDRTLKAFSIVMLKTIDLIRDRVNRASVFEEVRIEVYSDFYKRIYSLTKKCQNKLHFLLRRSLRLNCSERSVCVHILGRFSANDIWLQNG